LQDDNRRRPETRGKSELAIEIECPIKEGVKLIPKGQQPEEFIEAGARWRKWTVTERQGSRQCSMVENTFLPLVGHAPPHWHEVEEILLVLTGMLTVIVGEHEVMAAAGDSIIIAPKEVHSLYNRTSNETRTIAFLPQANPIVNWV
jgi:quercetin dioxygenase-like cupin family protein